MCSAFNPFRTRFRVTCAVYNGVDGGEENVPTPKFVASSIGVGVLSIASEMLG